MGRHNDSYKKSFKYKLKSISQIISLVSTKSGRKAAKIFWALTEPITNY